MTITFTKATDNVTRVQRDGVTVGHISWRHMFYEVTRLGQSLRQPLAHERNMADAKTAARRIFQDV